MLQNILQEPDLIFYILAAESLILCLLQLRTNGLLKRTYKMRIQKKKNLAQMKEEVKEGKSDIPVVKFEKPKAQEKKAGYDPKEMAVLQEMMTEFFG